MSAARRRGWQVYRGAAGWGLTTRLANPQIASVSIPEAIAWRIFTKGIAQGQAERLVTIEGRPEYVAPLLGAVAILG